ncbi:MAG: methyltransferase domain-containing protein [Cytophagaceae bacterium]|jgi:SAM-dependent methyltransferase|nr:methyltransferase domain-containing protein [Cytophagaceae bacterium]
MKSIISLAIRKVPRKYLQRISPVIMQGMKIWYSGDKVECPICASTYRKMLPYGRITPRENALCPNCLSLERHRLMWLYLKNKTTFFSEKRTLLHIAPEHCFIHRFEKLNHLNYLSADIESPLAKLKMDIHSIPFQDNTIDIVFCNHVLEHVTDDIQCMKEFYRVLKPGGWAILQSPIDPNRSTTLEDPTLTTPQQREAVHGQDDHLRTYGSDYADRIRKAGFVVEENNYVKELPLSDVKRYCLPANEILYIARKL